MSSSQSVSASCNNAVSISCPAPVPKSCLYSLLLTLSCVPLQTAIQRLCTRLKHFDHEVESAHQGLVASILEPLSLILSLLVCTPTRAPQFTQLIMADGPEQQRPPDAAVLVSNIS